MGSQERAARLTVEDLVVHIGERRILDRVGLTAEPGQVVGLLGPNGSGKSTLLRSIFHSRRPTSGVVRLDGIDVWTQTVKWNARQIAVVLQEGPADFPLTCAQIVQMGRTVHKNLTSGTSALDDRLCAAAMRLLEVDDLAGAVFSRLSGGERQRVVIARALVQQPRLLLMDEPTNHLDMHHQLKVLEVARRLEATVVVALHDVNLAARFCDVLVLLDQGRVASSGSPEEVVTVDQIEHTYRVRAQVIAHPCGAPHVVLL